MDSIYSNRKIIHIDMDAFFASVEQRDNPLLKGKPVAVGGGERRGVVAAASYEARAFGVRSAMASSIARQKCPSLIFVRPRFEVYNAVSIQIREIFKVYTDAIEPLSLDEAYLDVTQNKLAIASATEIAKQIKVKIFEKTGLTASAGISFNKFLAKIASDYNKPNGLFLIRPSKAEAFVDTFSVHKFHGIGKVTAQKMEKMGIKTGFDLKQIPELELIKKFGKMGKYYFQICRAIDTRPVVANAARKTIGAENTFNSDLNTLVQINIGLQPIISEVWRRIEKSKLLAKTVSIKIKYNDFDQISRSKTFAWPIDDLLIFEKIVEELVESTMPLLKPVRLLGVSVSQLESIDELEGKQLTLRF